MGLRLSAVRRPGGACGRGGRGGQAAPDTSPKRLAGSNLEFTLAQIRDAYGPADWFPGDHPAMPEIVAHGKRPEVRACALCHYPNGKGRAENAPIAGLPVSYFIQQMNDFKERRPQERRAAEGQHERHDRDRQGHDRREIKASRRVLRLHAVDARGSRWWRPRRCPRRAIAGGMFLALEGNEKEPIGKRIIEMPENAEATEVLPTIRARASSPTRRPAASRRARRW